MAPADTAGPLPDGVTLTRRDADRSLRLRQVGEPVDVLGPEHQYPSGQYYLRDIHGAFDVVALGASATGSVGDTVRVEVGLRNDGPGVPDGTISGDGAARFVFTPPAGTVVTNTPARCWSSGSEEEEAGSTAPVTWHCTKPGASSPPGRPSWSASTCGSTARSARPARSGSPTATRESTTIRRTTPPR